MPKKSENLRKFRSDIAALKRRGLITGLDARSVTPANKRAVRAINKYEGVLSGKVTAVKLTKQGVAEYKALGKAYEIAAPKGLPRRVLIPHDANQKVTVSHGKVRVANPSGITSTILPVKFHDLPKYFAEVRKSKPPLKSNERFAFRFFGNRSHQVFRSINKLLEKLEHYESVFDATEDNDAEAQSEIYQNLEIITITNKEEWLRPVPSKHKAWKPSAYQKRKQKLERGPLWKQEHERAANAQRQKEYRARMKKSEKAKYKADGRKRAAKSKRRKK